MKLRMTAPRNEYRGYAHADRNYSFSGLRRLHADGKMLFTRLPSDRDRGGVRA